MGEHVIGLPSLINNATADVAAAGSFACTRWRSTIEITVEKAGQRCP
jgi:hypothetical protein